MASSSCKNICNFRKREKKNKTSRRSEDPFFFGGCVCETLPYLCSTSSPPFSTQPVIMCSPEALANEKIVRSDQIPALGRRGRNKSARLQVERGGGVGGMEWFPDNYASSPFQKERGLQFIDGTLDCILQVPRQWFSDAQYTPLFPFLFGHLPLLLLIARNAS